MKTISLENAKKLHEVAKEKVVELPKTQYFYREIISTSKKEVFTEDLESWQIRDVFDVPQSVSEITDYYTYTTDELLEWLPESIDNAVVSLTKHKGWYITSYDEINDGVKAGFIMKAETPADALCLLAIELIKSEVIK